MIFRHLLNMRSHPTWVRGLKHHHSKIDYHDNKSHPTWVRGLKLQLLRICSSILCRTLRGCVD